MNVAHISDIHVRWRGGALGTSWFRYLNKRVVGRLNMALARSHSVTVLEAAVEDLRRDPPDHLVVTGDLTNLAIEDEFLRARDLLRRADLPPERVSVIPGNHDTYTSGAYRARRFEQVFAEWLGGADEVEWPLAHRRGDVLFVCASSCVPSPFFTAWGRMSREQLARIGEVVADSDAPYRVLLVHHPPLLGNGRPDTWLHGNRDGAALLTVCREAGVDLLLCGHIHRPFDHLLPWPRPLRIVCAGSTTSAPRAPGPHPTYNRYRIEDGALRSIETRGYDLEAQAFVHVAWRTITPTRAVGT